MIKQVNGITCSWFELADSTMRSLEPCVASRLVYCHEISRINVGISLIFTGICLAALIGYKIAVVMKVTVGGVKIVNTLTWL